MVGGASRTSFSCAAVAEREKMSPFSIAEELRRKEEDERVKAFYSLVVQRVLLRVSASNSFVLSPAVTKTLEQVQ